LIEPIPKPFTITSLLLELAPAQSVLRVRPFLAPISFCKLQRNTSLSIITEVYLHWWHQPRCIDEAITWLTTQPSNQIELLSIDQSIIHPLLSRTVFLKLVSLCVLVSTVCNQVTCTPKDESINQIPNQSINYYPILFQDGVSEAGLPVCAGVHGVQPGDVHPQGRMRRGHGRERRLPSAQGQFINISPKITVSFFYVYIGENTTLYKLHKLRLLCIV
jgi:hypothetical protein